jgi:hypothetical protein
MNFGDIFQVKVFKPITTPVIYDFLILRSLPCYIARSNRYLYDWLIISLYDIGLILSDNYYFYESVYEKYTTENPQYSVSILAYSSYNVISHNLLGVYVLLVEFKVLTNL